MALIRQQPLQLSPPYHPPQLEDFSESNMPFGGNTGQVRTMAFRDLPGGLVQRPRHDSEPAVLPQQYAYPLSRHNSYTQGMASKEEMQDSARQSEHLLRRKTPNGILHAAYDGTSVEQTERPHAMKHIILPVSEQFSAGIPHHLPHDLPLRPHMPRFDTNYSIQSDPGSTPVNDLWRAEPPFSSDHSKPSWIPGQLQHPQIDSVLNQLPAQSPPYQIPQVTPNIFGFMPPPVHPSFVPTASNAPGPYGPYFPNGTFVPYQPAAIRDPRFYPQQHVPANRARPAYRNANAHNPAWNAPSRNQVAVPNYVNNHQQFPGLSPPGDEATPPSFHSRQFPYGPSVQEPYGLRKDLNSPAGLYSAPLEDNGFRPDSQFHNANLGMRFNESAAVSQNTTQTGTPLADFGPNSQNANMRDRVLNAAADIYTELVKHLSKMNGPIPNGKSEIRIYPKPPRKAKNDSALNSPRHLDGSMPSARQMQPSLYHRPGYFDLSDTAPSHHGHFYPANSPSRSPFDFLQDVSSRRPAPWSHNSGSSHGSLVQSPVGVQFPNTPIPRQDGFPVQNAVTALEYLTKYCYESSWQWVDGLLLGGSLHYALGDYHKAHEWYSKILQFDSRNVEAYSNLAGTSLAMKRNSDAEHHWRSAIKLRPSYFEAVEHLLYVLCNICKPPRNKEAIQLIEEVERALRLPRKGGAYVYDAKSERSSTDPTVDSPCPSEASDKPIFDYEVEGGGNFQDLREMPGSGQPGFGSSGYAIAGADNARIHTLIHAKGNLKYGQGDNVGAAKAFEEAVLITIGRGFGTVDGLVRHILRVLGRENSQHVGNGSTVGDEPLLLPPEKALTTRFKCFSPNGDLPGLKDLQPESQAAKAALQTTSNSLLSLAKIFQDGMASSSPPPMPFQTTYGVREILALYYLSLSLQQSPSTANNVGILLASVGQTVSSRCLSSQAQTLQLKIPGVVPGSGVSLALQYYNFGLNLDKKHAHLYTNLGSLLKDLGQLASAIKMYEHAVQCDDKFDIALANLANAVKDQGRIADAIGYYQRAVDASPDFAEAVCGLANALNSVCGWHGRGGIAEENGARDRWHVDDKGMLKDASLPGAVSSGWIKRVVDLVDKQLVGGEHWGRGIITSHFVEQILHCLAVIAGHRSGFKDRKEAIMKALNGWAGRRWEGAKVVRLVERIMKKLTWQWYHDRYVEPRKLVPSSYNRPQLPPALPIPAAPTVLPFHTFTCPMSARQIRHISQRNGLRISCSTLKSSWLSLTVNEPPRPPNPYLKVGYVSSDFNNHPLAHLMQSVFGMHDTRKVKAYCYATTASDNSMHRLQIEREAPVFFDASSWSVEHLVRKIVEDGIHILVNLNGYTRGAKNEVFAARPAPIQMSFMGFAGTLGAEWCDYLLADETAVPMDTLKTWRRNVEIEDILQEEVGEEQLNGNWIYSENIVYCRDTFFCCDHRQSAPDAKEKRVDWNDELSRRWAMRKEIFPNLPDDAIILGNFNQLYKIEPTTFRTWLRILDRVPRAVLWLLRFPDLGEQYLKKTALAWAGAAVASRVLFTDVAPKQHHISRARVCDLFLDTPECNAHTTAADILWSGTPLLTLPRYKYKMCSRMAASILKGALPHGADGDRAARDLIAGNEQEYEDMAVKLASRLRYRGYVPEGRLGELRKLLFEGRWTSPLFDTRRWVRDLEEAYGIAWERWVRGEGGDIILEREDKLRAREMRRR